MPMYHTPSDTRERHAYIDASLGQAESVLRRTGMGTAFYGGKLLLADVLNDVVVPNVCDGVVYLSDIDPESEALPVVALWHGEELSVSDDLIKQSPRQRKRTAQEITTWQPANKSGNQLADEVVTNFQNAGTGNVQTLSMRPGTCAVTFSSAAVFDMERMTKNEELTKPPVGRLGKLLMRPMVALAIIDDVELREEQITHELIHVIQKREKPLRVFKSQKNADMHELRMELEAYHAGAGLRLFLDNRDLHDITPEDIVANEQLAVELVRHGYNHEDPDPFRPSPMILKDLATLGWGHILHQQFPYDELIARLEEAEKAQDKPQ